MLNVGRDLVSESQNFADLIIVKPFSQQYYGNGFFPLVLKASVLFFHSFLNAQNLETETTLGTITENL